MKHLVAAAPDQAYTVHTYIHTSGLDCPTHSHLVVGIFSNYYAIPASFRSYCEAALKAEKSGSTDTVVPSADIYKFRHCKAYVVEGDAANMCCQDVRDVYPTFMGSNLFLADIPVV